MAGESSSWFKSLEHVCSVEVTINWLCWNGECSQNILEILENPFFTKCKAQQSQIYLELQIYLENGINGSFLSSLSLSGHDQGRNGDFSQTILEILEISMFTKRQCKAWSIPVAEVDKTCKSSYLIISNIM